MREIYNNAGNDKFSDTVITTNQAGPRSSGRRFRGAALCIGLLIVFLLAGLIGFVVYYFHSVHSAAAELSSLNKKICPTGWTMFSSSCYLLSTVSHSWTEGRDDCKHRGADLVVIESAKEQDFVSRLTMGRAAWIGLSDRDNEGTWKWVDGTPLTVKYWAKDQPDNHGGKAWRGKENCAHIRAHSAEWNDLPCEDSLQWICEKKT